MGKLRDSEKIGARIKAKHQESAWIHCACGCNTRIKEVAANGHRTNHVRGHLFISRLKEQNPQIDAKIVFCKCGCKQKLLNLTDGGNKRNFINGHKHAGATKGERFQKKLLVLKYYGGESPKCECCGELRTLFLAIDHIKGNGNAHRRETGLSGGHHFYSWLINQNFPAGFRILCHNCNMAIGIWGQCPHKRTLSNAS